MSGGLAEDLGRLAKARLWLLLLIAFFVMVSWPAAAPPPRLGLSIGFWDRLSVLLFVGVAVFLLLEGALRLSGGAPRGSRPWRLALFGGWWFGVALSAGFLWTLLEDQRFDMAALDIFLAAKGRLLGAEAEPPYEIEFALIGAAAATPALLAWLALWALVGPAMAAAAAGRDDGPIGGLTLSGFWRRFGALLLLAAPLRFAAIALTLYPLSWSVALSGQLSQLEVVGFAAAALSIRFLAGLLLGLALLAEALAAHRAYWSAQGAGEQALSAFE